MKKFVSLILSLAVCISLVPTVFAVETVSADNKFADVPAGAWYLDDLNYALANGYISGTGDNTFSPEGNITRGQFVTILGRMLGVSTASGVTKFTDVAETSYYAPYVGWAAQNGYVNGTSDTTFAPDALITFEQMGTILANYISKTGVELTGYSASEAYKDTSSISQWAAANMEVMRQYGLIPTDASGNVRPQTPVNRAEGTVSLVRLAKATGLGEEPTIIQPPTPQTPTQQTGKVTYGSLIKGDPQLIRWHELNDVAAIDNNIRYMLKNELTEVELDITDIESDPWSDDDIWSAVVSGDNDAVWGMLDDNLVSRYSKVLEHYTEFGYRGIRAASVGSTTVIYLGATPSNAESEKYRENALVSAIKVHDDMWSSGKITNSMTQKEKARVYYDWVIKNCSYADDGGMTSDIPYGVFIDGKAACEGYTSAYNLLLRLEGLDCSTESTIDHMWTTATLDGVLYHIDATWGDTDNANKYFCMTPEASWAIHK